MPGGRVAILRMRAGGDQGQHRGGRELARDDERDLPRGRALISGAAWKMGTPVDRELTADR